MPYIFEPRPNEATVADVLYQPSPKVPPFRVVVTNQAFFHPATKFVVAGDPHYLKRVELSDVREVCVESVSPIGFYVAAVIMTALGLAILWTFSVPGVSMAPRSLGWALAITVGGFLLPLAGRGRRRLRVRMRDAQYRWTPPLVVDPASKRQINEAIDAIVRGFRSLDVRIVDGR